MTVNRQTSDELINDQALDCLYAVVGHAVDGRSIYQNSLI